ncbi:B-cell receptor CD22 [Anabarilius grahami]|uniref:B-cell receptor CD22 n=1 Tax=Anabarilius grahami TaxID=495550 RepID=A0A3N0Z234_ANAGA|nr:B-cell receptor CD22 [Anabarilius grahami]
MNCTYTYPTGYQIMKVYWTKGDVKDNGEFPDLSEDPEYSQRLQYLGDKQKNCTIRLSHVTLKDSRMYYFRFTTNVCAENWTCNPGVYLAVTDPPENAVIYNSPSCEIVSGDSVTLICISDSNPPAEIYWYKGGTFVGSQRIYSISKISSDDSGEYKCRSINEHGEKYSDAVTLNIMYPPRRVSVSIIPSGQIWAGDSVTLNCSSDSNPPAEISWFKGRMFVGSGRIFNIPKISSDDSGEYKCKSKNKHGEKYSDALTVNIMHPPRSVSVSIIQSGQILEGDSVTLTCSSDSNPPALNFSWFKGTTYLKWGQTYNISKISSDDSGEYKCISINEHGEKYSDNVTLNVMYPPRNVSVLITGSGEIVSGDSVTLICSSDSNPPALNFSWFKENESLAVGSGQSFGALQSGRFYCQAQNQHGSQRSDAVTVTGEAFINTLLYLHIIHQFGELIMMIFLFQFTMMMLGM